MQNNYVKIFDTTLRDGEQSPGFSMHLEEKIRLAIQLEKLGVDVIEAGFPAASPEDFESVKRIAQTLKTTEICGLSRAMESDITTCYEAIKHAKKPRIHTFLATSPIHMEFKLKKTPSQILTMATNAVKFAKSLCDRVDFSPEDAGRSDRQFLVEIIEAAIQAGADTINIPDTVGFLQPSEFGDLIRFLIKNVKNSDKAIFATHCHNDLGLATSNSLAGVLNGARQIECTVNGIGERAGNCALEEAVMSMRVRKDFFNLQTGINTEEIHKTSRLLEQITGQKVQSNKAIVGKNAFAHESGIHQDGMLKNRETYEILTPESIGLDKNEIILGKHSGRAALKAHLQKMGYTISDEKMPEIFVKFKTLADKKKELSDFDLDALMMGENHSMPQKWALVKFEVTSGSQTPWCKLTLKNLETNNSITKENTGTGMVDAAYKNIEAICGNFGKLTEFYMENVTNGLDAQAVVNIRLENLDGKVLSGKYGDTDIVKAAIMAYLEVINKATLTT
ncbi:2-isopropylmalate synthase [Candidatus Gracilibacteria bacterium]|nr:2-isopropylmalate synthase [Candidatus Gracilibacteria bacterium]